MPLYDAQLGGFFFLDESRQYFSAVTKHANRLGLENGWPSRFHDHIIRNDAEYQRISNYIINNPANCKDDKFYSA